MITMKRFLACILALLFGLNLISAHNAFTIHDGLNTPIHVYYDTDMKDRHISFSIYPHGAFKTMNQDSLNTWRAQSRPICGAFLIVVEEADNDSFYVEIGRGDQSLSGYLKRGTVASITNNRGTPLYLYASYTDQSKKEIVADGMRFVRLLGKKQSWFYVEVIDDSKEPKCGWLPSSMLNSNFLRFLP